MVTLKRKEEHPLLPSESTYVPKGVPALTRVMVSSELKVCLGREMEGREN